MMPQFERLALLYIYIDNFENFQVKQRMYTLFVFDDISYIIVLPLSIIFITKEENHCGVMSKTICLVLGVKED